MPIATARSTTRDVHGCIVVGAGPAGLATSHALLQHGVEHVVLERGHAAGHCWSNTYDSLRLHTGKHLSALPGLRFPGSTPLFPTRADFVAYLQEYVRRFALPVRFGVDVTRITHTDVWRLETTAGELRARTLVMATGLMSNPLRPDLPGMNDFAGDLLHSVGYREPHSFTGRRVLVVGVGNSGGEVASELARHGVDTTIAVRSGANVVPLTIAGLPTQYVSVLLRKLPRTVQEWAVERVRRRNERKRPPVLPRARQSPLDAIPLIGFHLVDEIAAGRIQVRGGIERFTRTGVRFLGGAEEGFDVVILATGFRPALQPLQGSVRTNERGFALRRDRVQSADQPSLFFVGHNYDASGGLRNIARDAPLAARQVAALL